ncbi:MAG: AmmeMemoRadiSam system protein B [candidate division Zixibacteria bacterium]|nr:AmmeMemoRadiSam system protein B [candidate division Zixibacteria bacterium]
MRNLTALIIIFLSVIYSVGFCSTRYPAVDGRFYPGDKNRLKQKINQLLENVPDQPQVEGKIVSLIVPHAGYIYSGQTAAYGYKLISGLGYDAIIIVGVSHRQPFTGSSVWKEGAYITPLGSTPVAVEIAREMMNFSPRITFRKEVHIREHSVEVQVPFIQYSHPGVPIVPVLTGDRDEKSIDALADALVEVSRNRNILLIASTDLAHYVSREKAYSMDEAGIESIINLDYSGFLNKLKSGKTQFCGGSAVAAVLKASRQLGADRAYRLHYYDSGYATGDKSSVVSYLAVAITDLDSKPKKGEVMKENKAKFTLDEQQKKTLLKIAREAIGAAVAGNATPLPPTINDPVLLTKSGAFVTITKHGQLRGCIGYTEAFKPLYETVHECAISAAMRDPRFHPLTADELDNIHLEISVLTPMEKVENLEEIKVGRDGLMIEKGMHRGLLLPQVATDYGWDRETFLQQTCRKAGLPMNAYKDDDAVIYSFSALIFEEE